MIASVSSSPAEFQPDDIVGGRYQIIRKLADGGMGTVFLAEHVLIKRRVALKLLHAELAADGAMVQRFMNEAAAAGTLGHPNIVESTDMGFTQDGVPFIVFEYLDGCLLTEEVYRLGGLPIRRALELASQIASALEAAHNAQIAHLDLKSDNVFLIPKDGSLDHIKVLDFGISKFMAADVDKTQRGILMGTPEYMAPEQVTTPDLVDGRVDIYALGVLLYEMLTARRPFVDDDPRVVLHRIVHEAPPPLRRSVPPSIEHLLFDRLLAKQREQRIQTMREVKLILDEISSTLRPDLPEASPTAFDEPGPEPEDSYIGLPVRGHRPPRPWWPLAALVVAAAGGLLWLVEYQVGWGSGSELLRNLRSASWALSVTLLLIYALGWIVFGVRGDPNVVHRSYVKRSVLTKLEFITPRRPMQVRIRR
jgi:eukaryotic-like serine/threonine-protein kinase